MATSEDAVPALTCPCCLGDPDLVCDACGQHSCWAGIFMCDRAVSAGVTTRADYAAKADERIDAIRADFPADMTAGEFAEHLPEDLRQPYWRRKIGEFAGTQGIDPDAEETR